MKPVNALESVKKNPSLNLSFALETDGDVLFALPVLLICIKKYIFWTQLHQKELVRESLSLYVSIGVLDKKVKHAEVHILIWAYSGLLENTCLKVRPSLSVH